MRLRIKGGSDKLMKESEGMRERENNEIENQIDFKFLELLDPNVLDTVAVTLVVDIIMDCVYNNNNFLVWLNSNSKESGREREWL